MFIEIDVNRYTDFAKYLRKRGFTRLLTVSAIDWIEIECFEIYYIVYNEMLALYIKVSTYIDRNKPIIKSLSNIWKNAMLHERECWEMFGIIFEGNNMLKPLFTEGWNGPPPFKKDFNWRKYVKEAYELR